MELAIIAVFPHKEDNGLDFCVDIEFTQENYDILEAYTGLWTAAALVSYLNTNSVSHREWERPRQIPRN